MLRVLPWLTVGGFTFSLCILRLLAQDAAPAPAAVRLPVTRVVLTNAGIGYFHREGTITGNARVELKVPEEDINDLILTLLTDDAAGASRSYAYDNRAPAVVTLKAFRIDLAENPTVSQLLHQVRGETVEIAFDEKSTVSGSIVSVEKPQASAVANPADESKPVIVKPAASEVDRVNLFTDDGLTSVPLAKIRRVKFLKPELQAEFKLALKALAAARGIGTKSLIVTFNGNGERKVSLGYAADAPLWKPTYRLRMTAAGAVLEGLAAIENTTDDDWQNVSVKLVSAKPITFKMDLYEPVYVPRPVIELELYASLRPPVYQSASFGGGQTGAQGAGVLGANGVAQNLGGGGGIAGIGGGFGGGGTPRGNTRLSYEEFMARQASNPMAIPASELVSGATRNLGEAFEYDVKDPVTLARNKSALVPVMKEPIEAERVSIYNPAAIANYPLQGLRIRNTSKYFLATGPVSVFDGERMVGQARLADVKPGESRLLSFAIDLDVTMTTEHVADERTPVSMKIADGVLRKATRVKSTRRYRATNKSTAAKTVWITQPIRSNWKLIAPTKPIEQTADYNRFEMKLAAGGTASLDVIEQTDEVSQLNLAAMAADDLDKQLADTSATPAVKAVLLQVKYAGQARAELAANIDRETAAVKEFIDEQARLRANLLAVPKDSDAYKRTLKSFDDNESEITTRRAAIKALEAKKTQTVKDLETMLKTAKAE